VGSLVLLLHRMTLITWPSQAPPKWGGRTVKKKKQRKNKKKMKNEALGTKGPQRVET
jgi:hypothetical protein